MALLTGLDGAWMAIQVWTNRERAVANLFSRSCVHAPYRIVQAPGAVHIVGTWAVQSREGSVAVRPLARDRTAPRVAVSQARRVDGHP